MTAPRGIDRKVQLHRLGAPTAAVLILALLPVSFAACGSGGDSSSSTAATGNDAVAQKAGRAIRRFGHEATGSQAKQAEAAVTGYLDARTAEEWSKACSYLAKSNRDFLAQAAAKVKQIQGDSCAAFLAASEAHLSASERADFAGADVEAVRVEDGQGLAIYGNSAGAEYSTSIKAEGGKWKVAASGGTPLKP